jgi:hypothetical protein
LLVTAYKRIYDAFPAKLTVQCIDILAFPLLSAI